MEAVEQPPAKRAKLDVSAVDVVYDPASLVDFLIVSSDGKILAVHRAFLLRYSSFFGKLLEACPVDQVTVTETLQEIRSFFLDVLYDRHRELQPNDVLRVLDLADKYEAPQLLHACSPTPVRFEEEEGHCSFLDALALASKYDFEELLKKCLRFLTQHKDGNLMLYLSFGSAKEKLGGLKQEHLVRVVQTLTASLFTAQLEGQKEKSDLEAEKEAWKREKEELQKTKDSGKERYSKLLQKYNRFIAKAKGHGVTP